jgi:hypothetical protein
MKKVKLMVLILSAFFAFGIQSASAQYVDVQVAKNKVLNKINTLSKEMETAKDVGGVDFYYELLTKQQYYSNLMFSFKKQLSVEDALEQTTVEIVIPGTGSDSFTQTTTAPNPTAVANAKQFMVSLKDEAIALLKI